MNPNWKETFENFNNLGKYLFVAGVVVALSFLYPSTQKFKYEFQKGHIWNYETLEAPFDFVIHKSAQEISQDKEEIEREFSPAYTLNPNVANTRIQEFEASFDKNLTILEKNPNDNTVKPQTPSIKELGSRLLQQVYNRGIVELASEHSGKGSDFTLNIINGRTAQKQPLGSLLTIAEAEQLIKDSLSVYNPAILDFLWPLMQTVLGPNIQYDGELTSRLQKQAFQELVSTKGVVKKNEVIATKGVVISDDVYDKLVSLRKAFYDDSNSQASNKVIYFGYLLLTALILAVFMMYIQTYRREIFQNWNFLIFVMMWLVIMSYFTYLVEKSTLSVYIVPYCIVPIIVRHFFTYRLAFFTHVVVVLISGFLTTVGYQFIFMQIVAGVVAVLAVADARAWSKFFQSVLLILLTYMIAYLGLSLIEEGDFGKVDWTIYNWIFINAVLTMLAFPIIPIIERTFGFLSSISLLELADMNKPLIRELSIKAPGTMQHSLQVANIAEAAANEIGANALLVRVGALYHDVGKMYNPEFFIENQTNVSPHESIDHFESARIIREHVTRAAQLARKHRVPPKIIRFIQTHHGTTKVEYFYRKCMEEHPGETVNEMLFTYEGPKPRSKEETVLMLADSIEATSRAFNNPTGEDLDCLVDSIIAGKMEKGQLDNSHLNFEELEKCRVVFKKMLRSIYHIRIEYPKEVKS